MGNAEAEESENAVPVGRDAGVPGFDLPDGTFIHERKSYIDSPNLVVFRHGDGQHLQNYEHVAQFLNDAGFSVYMWDGRCHGLSGGGSRQSSKDFPNGFLHYQECLEFIIRNRLEDSDSESENENRFKNIFLMGHSLGTTLLTYVEIKTEGGLQSLDPRIRGVVLMSMSMQYDISWVTLLMSGGAQKIWPSLQVLAPFKPEQLTTNEVWQTKLAEDPLLKIDGYTAWYGGILVKTMHECHENLDNFRIPVIVLHGDADVVTPLGAGEGLINGCSSEDKEMKVYEGIAHEILLDENWQKVVQDAVDWMNERRAEEEEEE